MGDHVNNKWILLTIILFLLTPSLSLGASLTSGEKRRIESAAEETLKEIIDLWKNNKFEELYEYGSRTSKVSLSKEKFVNQMKNKYWGLASSWETIRDIESDVHSSTSAYVKAKIGFKPKAGGDSKFVTETFTMILESGKWRTGLSKILSSPK